jgi:hypothetical protein
MAVGIALHVANTYGGTEKEANMRENTMHFAIRTGEMVGTTVGRTIVATVRTVSAWGDLGAWGIDT